MKATAMVMAVALACGVPRANALTRNANPDIRVVPPSALPDVAQQQSNDLLLHECGNGTMYLYLEQEQGARLVVLNVTDPANIRLAASVDTGLTKTWDFVRPVSNTLELIQFRDGSGSALLDLRNAKSPRVGNIQSSVAEPIRMLGSSAYLAVALRPQPVEPRAHDVQVVDTSSTTDLLATVAGVTRMVERSETGTIFLLGSGGLTVIRRLDVEQRHAMEELMKSHN